MKSLQEIYNAFTEVFAERVGFMPTEGSELSLRLSVYASQVFALMTQASWLETQMFPQTATGESLDRHAFLRGLTRQAGARAEGAVMFGIDTEAVSDLVVPAGTQCLTEGLTRFETITEGVIPAGEQSVTIPARACEAGTAGNVHAGRVTLMNVPPVGVAWCLNPFPFVGGRDGEDDESLRVRVLESFYRLPNGANVGYYEREALRIDGVAAVNVLPRVNGRGTVGVFVATESGMPEEALCKAVRAHLDEMREIAVDVTVSAPEEVPVTVNVWVAADERLIAPEDKAAFLQTVEARLAAYFTGRLLGQGLRRIELGHVLYNTPGVKNFRVLQPETDIPAMKGELVTLGGVDVEFMPQEGGTAPLAPQDAGEPDAEEGEALSEGETAPEELADETGVETTDETETAVPDEEGE